MEIIKLKTTDTALDIIMRYEQVDYKWYQITLVYDKDYNIFWVLINGINESDILDSILNVYSSDEVSLYLDQEQQELNLNLLSLIYNAL